MVKQNKTARNNRKRLIQTNNFQIAVSQCSDLQEGYRPGLQALKKGETAKICVSDTTGLNGSVDIDSCTKEHYPEDSRWDYAIGYKGKAFFVEIHPAFTSEINTVLKKKEWLEKWLDSQANSLNSIRSKEPSIFWIFTEKCGILKSSPQYRRLAQEKLCPMARLILTDEKL